LSIVSHFQKLGFVCTKSFFATAPLSGIRTYLLKVLFIELLELVR